MTSDKDFDQDFDLDDLKAAMTTATPAPEAETRAAHIALAERSFADYHAARPADAAPKGLLAGLAKALRGFGTKGGLKTDTSARVLREDGSVIDVPGVGCSWFKYGGDYKWKWQRDVFDLMHYTIGELNR